MTSKAQYVEESSFFHLPGVCFGVGEREMTHEAFKACQGGVCCKFRREAKLQGSCSLASTTQAEWRVHLGQMGGVAPWWGVLLLEAGSSDISGVDRKNMRIRAVALLLPFFKPQFSLWHNGDKLVAGGYL